MAEGIHNESYLASFVRLLVTLSMTAMVSWAVKARGVPDIERTDPLRK